MPTYDKNQLVYLIEYGYVKAVADWDPGTDGYKYVFWIGGEEKVVKGQDIMSIVEAIKAGYIKQ